MVGVKGYMKLGLRPSPDAIDEDGVKGKEANDEASDDVDERER